MSALIYTLPFAGPIPPILTYIYIYIDLESKFTKFKLYASGICLGICV